MSNLMHKVKDAMTGHHHPEGKEPTHDSPKMANTMSGRDTHGSSTVGAKEHGSTTYTSSTMGSDTYGTGAHHDPKVGKVMNTGNTYGSTATGTGVIHDSKKGPMDINSSTLGSGAHDPNTRADNYRSSNVNAGPHQSKMANKLDPRVDSDMDNRARNINAGPHESKMSNTMDPRIVSDLDNRGTHETFHTTSTAPTGAYTSNYGTAGGNSLGSTPAYSTRFANTGSDPISGMAPRAEPGFGGTAAGGSSYNAPESGERKNTGLHSSNLLNKLDPQVHSSDHESRTSTNQRGGI